MKSVETSFPHALRQRREYLAERLREGVLEHLDILDIVKKAGIPPKELDLQVAQIVGGSDQQDILPLALRGIPALMSVRALGDGSATLEKLLGLLAADPRTSERIIGDPDWMLLVVDSIHGFSASIVSTAVTSRRVELPEAVNELLRERLSSHKPPVPPRPADPRPGSWRRSVLEGLRAVVSPRRAQLVSQSMSASSFDLKRSMGRERNLLAHSLAIVVVFATVLCIFKAATAPPLMVVEGGIVLAVVLLAYQLLVPGRSRRAPWVVAAMGTLLAVGVARFPIWKQMSQDRALREFEAAVVSSLESWQKTGSFPRLRSERGRVAVNTRARSATEAIYVGSVQDFLGKGELAAEVRPGSAEVWWREPEPGADAQPGDAWWKYPSARQLEARIVLGEVQKVYDTRFTLKTSDGREMDIPKDRARPPILREKTDIAVSYDPSSREFRLVELPLELGLPFPGGHN